MRSATGMVATPHRGDTLANDYGEPVLALNQL